MIEAMERIRRRPGCHHPDNEEDAPTIIAAIKGPARDLFPADRASFRRVICRIWERLRRGNGMANDTGTNGPFRETAPTRATAR